MSDTGRENLVQASAAAALRIESVRFEYPSRGNARARVAVDDVTLTVPQGQAVAMLGPNGSGKSTLLRIVCGLLQPRAGRVEVFGRTPMQGARSLMGVVFQRPSLDRHLTVWENLRDSALMHGLGVHEAASRIEAALREDGLIDRRHDFVKTLSGGLARRVDLVRALLHRPPVLLLDEPTAGLDPAAREQFLDLLFRMRHDRALTIVMSTHLVDEADRHDRVVLMHGGTIAADDAPAALRRVAGSRRVTVLDADWNPNKHLQSGVEKLDWHRTSAGWTTPVDGEPKHVSALVAEFVREGIAYSVAPPTLADVFERITGRELAGSQREDEHE